MTYEICEIWRLEEDVEIKLSHYFENLCSFQPILIFYVM
jgi:hypothetical protein